MELPPACLPATASKGPATPSPSTSLSRYSDCALIEIIHLHNCLRGALRALCADVRRLFPLIPVGDGAIPSSVSDVEGKISARFKVIWSVFRAHSSAEDEFIWPALRSKLGRGDSMGSECDYSKAESPPGSPQSLPSNNSSDSLAALAALEEAEYIEDHADEERMFSDFDKLLDDLKNALRRGEDIRPMVSGLGSKAEALSEHLMVHLAKEEEQCMPLVQEHLSPKEITDLVGNIMGKRSSDVVGQIITMAIQNLPVEERKSMVRYMMEAMVGTYFEKWLVMCGFENQLLKADKTAAEQVTPTVPVKPSGSKRPRPVSSAAVPDAPLSAKVARTAPSQLYCTATSSSSMDCLPEQPHTPQQDQHDQQSSASVNPVDDHSFLCGMTDPCLCGASPCPRPRLSGDSPVSGEMLQKLIRAVVQDTTLDMVRKNALIQSLRERVWKSNNLLRERLSQGRRTGSKSSKGTKKNGGTDMSTLPNVLTGSRRKTPPSFYYKRDEAGEIQLVWSSECGFPPADKCVPLFSASELAPTYHDGAAGGVLGCPHYARGCKLRHPSSGRLYTCRLCCEQERDLPTKDRDAPLDRYKVTEVMCMVCGALQPAGSSCANAQCERSIKPFAKYSCRICNLHDDSSKKSIYHCPFCNVCRAGKGLGIDFRHCMRCNACVSLNKDTHVCIPQTLQGHCSICHETMFESTRPLKGLKCGHVMHLSCFKLYVSGHAYTCPLCKKSVEDMRDRFDMLDQAIRMQPMPAPYANMKSTVYCQDCGETALTTYHFIGCKCSKCGSYNTRETERVSS